MPTPKSKRTIVLQSSNHDSELDSLRDAVAAAGDESTESESQNTLIAVDSEVRPIFTNTSLPFPASNSSPAFTDTINGEVFSSQVAESDGASSLASVHLTIVGSASLVTNTPLPYNVSLTSEPPVLAKTITVTNNRDSGSGSLRNAVDDSTKVTLKNLIIANGTGGSQDESTENGGNDILNWEGYPEARHDFTITTGNGNDSITPSLDQGIGTNFITGGNGNDSITPSLDQGIGTNFITGGNGNDSLVGDSQDTVFGDERLDILIWGDYSEPSRGKTEQFSGFPGLSISGNNTSRLTSTGDRYSDDNNSLESNYRATLYGGPGEDLFNARSDTSSPLPLPATNQSPGLTDTITDQLFSSQTETSGRTYIPVGAETVDSWSSSDFYSAMVEGRARDSLIDMLGDQGFFGSDGTSTLYGGMNDSLNGNNQTLIIEPPTDQLFPSGVSSVETTFTSISGNNTSFAVLLDSANTNAAAKNDGAWRARGSTFETDSFGTPASFAGDLTISGNNSSQVIL
ncbi:hypothetical protein NDI47_06965 [Microcoleus vaginatus GB1-A2]|uniref:hypothetical protein n=1 Tax=Microcoleus vaginatus TaxID=119532 RepID=UPI00168A0B19|nr:hypothetical protein [Microcoleus sp. FACHB-61]